MQQRVELGPGTGSDASPAAMGAAPASRRWNHNLLYRHVLLSAMPGQCRTALDVGCGEGNLARALRQSVPRVTAIDQDERCIELARELDGGAGVEHVLGDFLTHPLTPGGFDFVVSVAALHHMDEEVALERMRELLAPGGTLAVLGLARSSYPADLPRDIVAVAVHQARRRLRARPWQSPAPTVWPPPHTYREIRAMAERTLPGARFRRHLLWRYSLVWTKPASTNGLVPRDKPTN
jgi:SAM-dependent methyltransferase